LLLHLAKKAVIDKSCIMMCDQWGEHGCLQWVMRCKGGASRSSAVPPGP